MLIISTFRLRQQIAFTLLETLIALFLFSLTLLTLYQSYYNQSRQIHANHYFQQAVNLTVNLKQYLQSHPNEDSSAYLNEWQAQIQSSLPAASGSINPQNQIKITWGGMLAADCSQTTAGTKGCLITDAGTKQ